MKIKQKKISVFELESVPRAVAALAVPSVLSMLVTVLYNMVDTVFVGQTHDPYQMNAVSMATPIFMILMAFGNLFGIGGCAFISRSLGAKEYGRVKKISSFSFWGSVAIGLICTFIMTLGVGWILPLLGADAATNIAGISGDLSPEETQRQIDNFRNLEQYTRDYLFYIGVGAIPTVLSSAMSNLVKGEGAAKVSMAGMMIGAITNIILDPIMILAMGMGVKGAAIATSIGNTVATLFYLGYLKFSHTMLTPNPKQIGVKHGIFTGVFSVGIPMFCTNLLMSLSNLLLNRLLNHIDVLATGGMGIAMKANMLVVFLQLGIGIGIQPLVGFHYGARNFAKMTKVIRFSMCCTLVLGTIMTAIYFLFTEPIVSIFMTAGSSGSAADVAAQQGYAVKMLRALMVSGPFLGIIFVNNNAFQGMGRGLASLILSVSRQGLIFLPVLLIANALIGLDGLIFAQPIADICSVIMALIMMEVIKKKELRQLKPGIRA
ncbi:MATE family efflux transporter [uncultured Ruminococcus sp.]|uniref:MATE family efflux transporter n=1 Tax=uncultured Ruminococcus sp. TaxID=165186 RepID=UPI0025D7B6E3|nr:MATE family efflux transporter [uncultured Ruminococcus sp.]